MVSIHETCFSIVNILINLSESNPLNPLTKMIHSLILSVCNEGVIESLPQPIMTKMASFIKICVSNLRDCRKSVSFSLFMNEMVESQCQCSVPPRAFRLDQSKGVFVKLNAPSKSTLCL